MRNLRFLCLALVILSASIQAKSQMTHMPVREGVQFRAGLLDNMMLLNNLGESELPFVKQMLYKWAETRLARVEGSDYSSLADYHEFQNYCIKHKILLIGGPLLGNISDRSADIWVRTSKPSEVSILLIINGKERTFGPVATTIESQLSAVVRVDELDANKEYSYEVFVDNEEIPCAYETKFRTTSPSRKINTRIVFGSCFHRWGLANMQQTTTIIERSPNAFLGLGDIAAQDRNGSVNWHSLDYFARDLYPAWQKLVARVPFYALWDDHDYFDNDKYGVPAGYKTQDKENVWDVFRYAWCNPSYGFGDDKKGVFFKTTIGASDVIMVDHRYFRTKGSLLGKEQMDWLKQQLLACKSPFIIIGCGTMWSDYVSNGKDSWGKFDTEGREEILRFIEENNIKGVLFISGDRHGSRGFRIPRTSGFSFYEFGVASLGGLGGQPATKPEWNTQTYGLNGGFAFGEFTFDTKPKDPTVTFRLVGEEGNVIYKLTVKQSELTPANWSPVSAK
ncbi:MAG: alkaline phosphatase D family protein [Bacteroidales bacterium]|nr:alkaline phosphatase D family protein [Bacteroidales bacterium]